MKNVLGRLGLYSSVSCGGNENDIKIKFTIYTVTIKPHTYVRYSRVWGHKAQDLEIMPNPITSSTVCEPVGTFN